MSEFQTQDSLERLLSDVSIDAHGSVLVSSVRKEPFAVVLLDEFEKAAPPIRDLFLQVFDDGRLTDQHGRLPISPLRDHPHVEHRLGDRSRRQARLYPDARAVPSGEGLEALGKSFRPEFLNRIDRVVVFRPFERAQMRALLDKELADVLARRGLRSRPWAVELDDSAYEFIIEQGFSPELGARPLKRAVERYLLAPLAEAIVEQTVPEGDQFLLIGAPGGERIEVTFIDPDLADETPAEMPEDEPGTVAPVLDLRALALAPRTDERTTRFLLDELIRVRPPCTATDSGSASTCADRDQRAGLLGAEESLCNTRRVRVPRPARCGTQPPRASSAGGSRVAGDERWRLPRARRAARRKAVRARQRDRRARRGCPQ